MKEGALIFSSSLLLVAFFVYCVIFLPEKEEDKKEQKQKELEEDKKEQKQKELEEDKKEQKSKFCQHCGKEIPFEAEICPKCGVRVKEPPSPIERKSSGLAAVFACLFTGLGQIYNGQIGKGIAFGIIGFILLLTMLIGIGFFLYPLFWVYTLYDAYNTAKKINAGEI